MRESEMFVFDIFETTLNRKTNQRRNYELEIAFFQFKYSLTISLKNCIVSWYIFARILLSPTLMRFLLQEMSVTF